MIQEVNEIRSKRLAAKRLMEIAKSVGIQLTQDQKNTIEHDLRELELNRLRNWTMGQASFEDIVRQAQYIKRVAGPELKFVK